MTGFVEAATVLGLISAITGICEAAYTVYDAYGDAKGLPNKFRTAADQIPLVCHTLVLAEHNIRQGNVGEQALETAMPVLKQCKDSAASLKELFDKTLPTNNASRTEWYKSALAIKVKSNDVKTLVEKVVNNLDLLAKHQIFQDGDTLKGLAEAIKELKNASDEQGQAQFTHSGAGSINTNTGSGTQSNYYNSESAAMYNAQTQHFDPRDDKTRIQDTKGGLLRDAYRWILENNSFRQWRSGPQGRVLWIRGDPGKGKTMLLCGIIDELEPSTCLSYFFCQATNDQLNHATAVLRGLIYMLILQRPALISHVRKKYDDAGKRLFEEINAWQALCKILTDMLADEQAVNAILLVDALDECTLGLPELLQLICKPSSAKWVVSSRNWPDIERKFTGVEQNAQLHLELNQRAISDAVAVYIRHRVEQLAREKKYDNKTEDAISQHLTANADGTFLWVALVCQVLADLKVQRRKALKIPYDRGY
ncbi:hypothetical protein HMPREF1624_03738 [Sporothrix schenckii ATCC 58251]|uniref:NACHT domain-containing protein n=1 Tax=Sporothrix schenckii (strain ATCC 58251 / de Perez 2211183) TaxID=1391915 RepID=U7PZI6_SPOS1|nr:hypothetical protein HMPREF1624_03738 [Sporothrix schenckii ATCC 58251]